MSRPDDVRALCGTALRLLPGIWQARNQLDLVVAVVDRRVHAAASAAGLRRPARCAGWQCTRRGAGS